MLDIATITALASSAVTALLPLLHKVVEMGAEELGKSSAGLLLDKLKQRLSHTGAIEALEDLTAQPDDSAAQGALNMQLRKALQTDPELAGFLKQWIAESPAASGVSQIANVHGDHNTTKQIVGSGNTA